MLIFTSGYRDEPAIHLGLGHLTDGLFDAVLVVLFWLPLNEEQSTTQIR